MNDTAAADEERTQVVAVDLNALSVISKAELDTQITTARAFPRSLKRFVDECTSMATLSEEIADECYYSMPRAGRNIEGPSVRLAEIVASAWGNCRASTRVVDEGKEFITAQGIFHDLERNVAIACEVKRRITDKDGKRYNADMIGVTGNAACSIALRNAIFKGVPKAFWNDIYLKARATAVGTLQTLGAKRTEALAYCLKHGIKPEMVFAALGVKGEQDIGLEELATLKGVINAVKEGDTTIEAAFAPRETTAPKAKPATAEPKEKKPSGQKKAAQKDKPPADQKEQPQQASMLDSQQATLAQIHEMLGRTGVPDTSLLARFEIGSFEELTPAMLNQARDWLNGVNRA